MIIQKRINNLKRYGYLNSSRVKLNDNATCGVMCTHVCDMSDKHNDVKTPRAPPRGGYRRYINCHYYVCD